MSTQTMHKAPAALYWPQNLEYVEYNGLDCFLDYEPPDRSVGYNGNAWLVHAYAGGVEVTDMLRDSVVREIEAKLCSRF